MNEDLLRSEFEAAIPVLHGMGRYVQARLLEEIQACAKSLDPETFLKIPCNPRVKDIDSFLTKALRRGKNYSDPIREIEDKVGLRFVVLYFQEIDFIGQLIEKETSWSASRDRDIESERQANPHHFSYESRHYVVKLKTDLTFEDLIIPAGTACEIQIRTLLQHAYAELAHDTTYKPTQDVSHKVLRAVAKGSALIETTDVVFEEVRAKIEEENKPLKSLISRCDRIYDEKIDEPRVTDLSLAAEIMEGYKEWLDEISTENLETLFVNGPWLVSRIRQRRIDSVFFKTGICLAVYLMAYNHQTAFPQLWPLDTGILELIYSDLGISPSW